MNTQTKEPLAVYVVIGKKRPIKTKQTIARDQIFPKTVEHDGQDFYFSNADLVTNTITYVSVDPNW